MKIKSVDKNYIFKELSKNKIVVFICPEAEILNFESYSEFLNKYLNADYKKHEALEIFYDDFTMIEFNDEQKASELIWELYRNERNTVYATLYINGEFKEENT